MGFFSTLDGLQSRRLYRTVRLEAATTGQKNRNYSMLSIEPLSMCAIIYVTVSIDERA